MMAYGNGADNITDNLRQIRQSKKISSVVRNSILVYK